MGIFSHTSTYKKIYIKERFTIMANKVLVETSARHIHLTEDAVRALYGDGAELTLGTYQFGVDVPPAKYDLKAVGGDGQFSFYAPEESEFSSFQDMALTADSKTSTYANLLCEEGARIQVDGTLKITLSKSKKQRGRLQKLLDIINQDP